MPDIEMPDEQDQSEVFDETHIDDEGDGNILPDEAELVFDVTQMAGDADEEEFDEDDIDLDENLGSAGIEAEADALLGIDSQRLNKIDGESDGLQGPDEVELVYSGLMEDARGAQASAAHWEARTLSDDDIEALGYGPDGDAAATDGDKA
ncbi:MAG: hypothetical protein DCF28_09230 [Alphaproteobacteria bacterium]|nr:MAG: hypothetical protein DCF28_09230 [Alphaproteobacteria bacterium]PZO37101.1 MAG: hypothetical protein DCE92_08075 [Alphaproteobacteria bacterium]